MFQPLNGPATYNNISVTSTAKEVKVDANPLDERKVVTIQPLNGDVYFGYDNQVTINTGTKIFKGQVYPLEAATTLRIWVVAVGTVDTRITEVG